MMNRGASGQSEGSADKANGAPLLFSFLNQKKVRSSEYLSGDFIFYVNNQTLNGADSD